jgi:hypothetical protein
MRICMQCFRWGTVCVNPRMRAQGGHQLFVSRPFDCSRTSRNRVFERVKVCRANALHRLIDLPDLHHGPQDHRQPHPIANLDAGIDRFFRQLGLQYLFWLTVQRIEQPHVRGRMNQESLQPLNNRPDLHMSPHITRACGGKPLQRQDAPGAAGRARMLLQAPLAAAGPTAPQLRASAPPRLPPRPPLPCSGRR